MKKRARIVWKKSATETFEGWASDCGRYRIWVQARVREGIVYTKEYAAQYMEEKPWLCDSAPFVEAKEVCQEHADARARLHGGGV